MYHVSDVLNRLYGKLSIKNDAEFCLKYNIKPNTLSTWRNRNSVPYELLFNIINDFNLSANYIFLGEDTSQNANLDGYWIKKTSQKVGAGKSVDVIDIVGTELEVVDDKVFIPTNFFKTIKNPKNLELMQVDGYSMIPDLLPDSYIIYEKNIDFMGDGFYVINFDGLLMVKTIQKKPNGELLIKSSNPSYDSFVLSEDTEQICYIVGKVLRCII